MLGRFHLQVGYTPGWGLGKPHPQVGVHSGEDRVDPPCRQGIHIISRTFKISGALIVKTQLLSHFLLKKKSPQRMLSNPPETRKSEKNLVDIVIILACTWFKRTMSPKCVLDRYTDTCTVSAFKTEPRGEIPPILMTIWCQIVTFGNFELVVRTYSGDTVSLNYQLLKIHIPYRMGSLARRKNELMDLDRHNKIQFIA